MFTAKRHAQNFDSIKDDLSMFKNDYDVHYEFYNDYNEYDTTSIDINSNRSTIIYSKNIKCSICNSDDVDKNYIIMSCCNNIVHIKCITTALYDYLYDNNKEMLIFNEDSVDKYHLDKIKCVKCDCSINYSDIFSIYSKKMNINKDVYEKFIIQKKELEEQKDKIENELKCVNDYIKKLENEKKISQIIMSKTFSLLSDI
jgi:hypothetical protein